MGGYYLSFIKQKISEWICSSSDKPAIAETFSQKLNLYFRYRLCGLIGGNARASIARDAEKAGDAAMKLAGYKCQITGYTENLRKHHLFDVSTYPLFAASVWNFFIMTDELHTEYHSWNGGTRVSCTIFGFWYWRYFVLQWYKGYTGIGSVFLLMYLSRFVGG